MNISEFNSNTIEVGSNEKITIDKLYGPMIACALRITSDSKTRKWIIEKEIITENIYEDETNWEIVCLVDY